MTDIVVENIFTIAVSVVLNEPSSYNSSTSCVGVQMGHGIGYMWAAVSTQVVGAIFCWQIALLGFLIIPLVSLGGGVFRRSLLSVSNSTRAQSSKADSVVEEVRTQPRTGSDRNYIFFYIHLVTLPAEWRPDMNCSNVIIWSSLELGS